MFKVWSFVVNLRQKPVRSRILRQGCDVRTMPDIVKLVHSLENENQNVVDDRESKNEMCFDSFRQRMKTHRNENSRRARRSILANDEEDQSWRMKFSRNLEGLKWGNSFPDWQYSNERKKQNHGVVGWVATKLAREQTEKRRNRTEGSGGIKEASSRSRNQISRSHFEDCLMLYKRSF